MLLFTASGIRGIVTKDLTPKIVKKIAIAYGSWLNDDQKKVIIGRDTRPSGKMIETKMIEGLIATGCEIIRVGICPTPIIIYEKKRTRVPAGVIISGSHNPPEWNGLKLISSKTFLSSSDIEEISNNLNKINLYNHNFVKSNQSHSIKRVNPIPEYKKALFNHVDYENIISQNNLKVVIDTGAGAGKKASPQILKELGCEVKIINNDLDKNNNFPREIEPIEKNLKDLIEIVKKDKYNVGFAFDCDADRLAIIGNDGICYPEDIGLGLITNYYLKRYENTDKKIIFVTNLASSLMFEALAIKFNAQIMRTPVGERYLVEKMEDLIQKKHLAKKNTLIFGGEGSCGGVMFPEFNNARDGIFAAAKIIEILVKTNEKISTLVNLLPKFYTYRQKINISNKNIKLINEQLKQYFDSDGQKFVQIGNDLKIESKNEWFVLIHPSNTEPIIRIISEAKTEIFAKKNCEKTTKLLNYIISKL